MTDFSKYSQQQLKAMLDRIDASTISSSGNNMGLAGQALNEATSQLVSKLSGLEPSWRGDAATEYFSHGSQAVTQAFQLSDHLNTAGNTLVTLAGNIETAKSNMPALPSAHTVQVAQHGLPVENRADLETNSAGRAQADAQQQVASGQRQAASVMSQLETQYHSAAGQLDTIAQAAAQTKEASEHTVASTNSPAGRISTRGDSSSPSRASATYSARGSSVHPIASPGSVPSSGYGRGTDRTASHTSITTVSPPPAMGGTQINHRQPPSSYQVTGGFPGYPGNGPDRYNEGSGSRRTTAGGSESGDVGGGPPGGAEDGIYGGRAVVRARTNTGPGSAYDVRSTPAPGASGGDASGHDLAGPGTGGSSSTGATEGAMGMGMPLGGATGDGGDEKRSHSKYSRTSDEEWWGESREGWLPPGGVIT